MIGNFPLECDLGLQTEDEGGTRGQEFGLIAQLEPFFRQQNINRSISRVFHHIVGYLDDLEGAFIIREVTAI